VGGAVPFIQIIEYKTSRLDEFNAALDGFLEATRGERTATRGVQTKDRDAEATYLQIVEFPSYEDAMANSDLPETAEFAAKLASLCDGPPSFRNLDVLREEKM
jgi:quinol monooxygenase YgiN